MNCRSAESLFSAFLEDELNQKERRSLETHLLGCRRCSLSLREVRAMLQLLPGAAVAETSPHFEEDVLARIRSGEAMRPTFVEWVHGLFEPARLRPLFLAGAGVCTVWIAFLVADPERGLLRRSEIARGTGATAGAKVEVLASDAPVTQPGSVPSPATDGGDTGANAAPDPTIGQPSSLQPVASTTQPVSSPRPDTASTGYARAERETPAAGSAPESSVPDPGSRYVDEYITDQFFLERGFEGSDNPTITPVSDRPSDDVYIIF